MLTVEVLLGEQLVRSDPELIKLLKVKEITSKRGYQVNQQLSYISIRLLGILIL
jgi:hypothetical protein